MNPLTHAQFRKSSCFLIGFFFAIPLLPAQEQSESASSLFTLIREGGWAMIPLGICSLALIYLAIHCFRETQAGKFGSDSLASRVADFCRKGNVDEAIHNAQGDPSLLGKALSTGLTKLSADKNANTETLDNSVAETFELEEHAVGQWIHYINVVATVAPMIGLLGTVSGMIGAFQTMKGGGMGRPELLAGDIGEALITTATGLCIGIPAMIAYSYFSNRLNNQLVENAQRAGAVSESLQASDQA